MKDLVEFTIDKLLQQERMQKPATAQQRDESGKKFKQVMAKLPDHAAMHRVPGSQLPTDNKTKDPALWKTSLELEAIFVQQMMTEMRKTVNKSEFLPSGFAEDVHGSMMDQAIAQVSSRQSKFGLAESIYKQLESSQGQVNGEISTQEISQTADKLKMANDLSLEARKHAH
ncbi:flagellar protein FlgJ [Mariprofundus micogutta]|uniref:Flagellar protein FlgJ n=1 Tax=Mariprofundus micogutta TaxID=1921010 RepID=A0A1L8CKK5_9PROT|nr:rod-binding protein [Mariprofundus micogutta]GAV19431.1 flagellar protein FlgJ [Mariprofundus micogutta]